MTKLLLSLGISPNVYNGSHEGTPLHHVASGRSRKMAKICFYHTPFNTIQGNLYPALPLNATEKNCWIEVTKLLLEHNADIEARDKNNQTPLHHAAKSSYERLAQLLLKHNAHVEARDKNNYTPLHHAVFHRSKDMLKLLLEHNADIEARDEDNKTPLHHAVGSSHNVQVAKLLLEHNADIETRITTIEHLFTMRFSV